MAKKIAVITWDAESVYLYAHQVKSFFGNLVDVFTYNVQDSSANHIEKADLYLVSTCAFQGESVNEYLPLGGEIVITQVTIAKEALYRLLAIPRGTRAMMVNINPRMVTETMAFLNQVGVNNVEFHPYYPGMSAPPILEIAVTPGESRYVPTYVKQIIDIGSRVLSAETIAEMAFKLKCEDVLQQPTFKKYVSTIVNNQYAVQCLCNRAIQTDGMYELLQSVLDAGVIGVDADGLIFTFNDKAQAITGINQEEAINHIAREVLPFLPFDECFRERTPIKSRLVKSGDVDINLTITPVIRRGNMLGAFAIVQRFNDEERKQHKLRMQLLNKGHETKYTFDSILGESPCIRNVKEIARRMSESNASVLITGESGTGKELFAHAIHAASPRSEYPFVAINCAAIPDTLLESELFGYENGAFTGAKKGGKIGFFEFAHKGTLFLDEIEGMSPLLQVKLLRVIQEQEVVRVGGHRVIHVDVRIIAATNEQLAEMVQRGEFRKDLYYRLGVLPVELPPLRERGSDILLLMEHMKQHVGADFQLSKPAEKILLSHCWDGNIRELRNCAEYLAYIGKKIILPTDLPSTIYKTTAVLPPMSPTAEIQTAVLPMQADVSMMQTLKKAAGRHMTASLFVLQTMANAQRKGIACGRKAIVQDAKQENRQLTEQEVRTIFSTLERLELIEIHRGRGGSLITQKGRQLVELVNMVD